MGAAAAKEHETGTAPSFGAQPFASPGGFSAGTNKSNEPSGRRDSSQPKRRGSASRQIPGSSPQDHRSLRELRRQSRRESPESSDWNKIQRRNSAGISIYTNDGDIEQQQDVERSRLEQKERVLFDYEARDPANAVQVEPEYEDEEETEKYRQKVRQLELDVLTSGAGGRGKMKDALLHLYSSQSTTVNGGSSSSGASSSSSALFDQAIQFSRSGTNTSNNSSRSQSKEFHSSNSSTFSRMQSKETNNGSSVEEQNDAFAIRFNSSSKGTSSSSSSNNLLPPTLSSSSPVESSPPASSNSMSREKVFSPGLGSVWSYPESPLCRRIKEATAGADSSDDEDEDVDEIVQDPLDMQYERVLQAIQEKKELLAQLPAGKKFTNGHALSAGASGGGGGPDKLYRATCRTRERVAKQLLEDQKFAVGDDLQRKQTQQKIWRLRNEYSADDRGK
ncbi:unnamed protein product, partial [Amoebophrya sp. A120]|eukprot:GSA120T00005720001.1